MFSMVLLFVNSICLNRVFIIGVLCFFFFFFFFSGDFPL